MCVWWYRAGMVRPFDWPMISHLQRRAALMMPSSNRIEFGAAARRALSSRGKDGVGDNDHDRGAEFRFKIQREKSGKEEADSSLEPPISWVTGKRSGVRWMYMDDSLRKKYVYIPPKNPELCPGCGVKKQSEDPAAPGYTVTREQVRGNKKIRLCQRCFNLRYYGREQKRGPQGETKPLRPLGVAPTTQSVTEHLKQLRLKDCVVVLVVDISFMHNQSFIPDLGKLCGSNPIMVVGNKVDLLPAGPTRLRLRSWLKEHAMEFSGLANLQQRHVHVVSSETGFGVGELISFLNRFRNGRDIYMVGAVNAGKSALINRISMDQGIGGVRFNEKYRFTESPVPGTTMGSASLALRTGGHIYDTPGMPLSGTWSQLSEEERKLLIPVKSFKPKIFKISAGKTIFFGGMGRLDYVNGPPLLFVVFASSALYLHPTDLKKAPELFTRQFGKLLKPPISDDSPKISHMKSMKEIALGVNEMQKPQAFLDIVLPGVGWVAVQGRLTADDNALVHAHVLDGGQPFTRKPLMPFEADSVAKRKKQKVRVHGGKAPPRARKRKKPTRASS